MAKTIGEVNWAAQLWTPAVQQRFDALFAVASRKSLSAWTQVPSEAAEVLILDGAMPMQDDKAFPVWFMWVVMPPCSRWDAHPRAGLRIWMWSSRCPTSSTCSIARPYSSWTGRLAR